MRTMQNKTLTTVDSMRDNISVDNAFYATATSNAHCSVWLNQIITKLLSILPYLSICYRWYVTMLQSSLLRNPCQKETHDRRTWPQTTTTHKHSKHIAGSIPILLRLLWTSIWPFDYSRKTCDASTLRVGSQ